MNGSEIIISTGNDVTKWDFTAIKAELERRLADYADLVYTDESIGAAKDDRATLRKVKKNIDDARKAYKKKCMEPYEAMEPKLKELMELIDRQNYAIDHVVKDYEARKKSEKEKKIREYYDRKAVILGELSDPLYDRILNPKWLNASTSKIKYEEGIQIAIDNAVREIAEIKSMNSHFVNTLIETYVSTLSIEDVKKKERELSEAVAMADLKSNESSVPLAPSSVLKSSTDDVKADGKDGVLMRIYADDKKLKKLTDFMRAVGVQYELL